MTSTRTAVGAEVLRAHLLLWFLFLIIPAVLGRSSLSGEEVSLENSSSLESTPPLFHVDLRKDSIQRLVLIEGVGPALAGRIIRARQELQSSGTQTFSCRCVVTRIAGVPNRVIMDAGAWLLPLPCPKSACRYEDISSQTSAVKSSKKGER